MAGRAAEGPTVGRGELRVGAQKIPIYGFAWKASDLKPFAVDEQLIEVIQRLLPPGAGSFSVLVEQHSAALKSLESGGRSSPVYLELYDSVSGEILARALIEGVKPSGVKSHPYFALHGRKLVPAEFTFSSFRIPEPEG